MKVLNQVLSSFMITVLEADHILETTRTIFPAESRELAHAFGTVLREDLFADRDHPPAHQAAMDGIAIAISDWESGRRRFKIQGIQRAGIPVLIHQGQGYCLEIMTGAVLPQGCDSVIPVEQLRIEDQEAVCDSTITPVRMQNIRSQAGDYCKGQCLLSAGQRLLSPQIAIAAAIGKTQIRVTREPRIALIGTGDEVVEIDAPAAVYQVRCSNIYAMQAALDLRGYRKVNRLHIADDPQILRQRLEQLMMDFDILVVSGGISMGKFDFIPRVLEDLGVNILFHKVCQRPGKPFLFGSTARGAPVFALPGNPVSALICFYRYVLPHIDRSMGIQAPRRALAVLSQDYRLSRPLTVFVPVQIIFDSAGQMTAHPVEMTGSGDYAAMGSSDGFIELDYREEGYRQGTRVPFFSWR
jgi:molybdopterin molybdotransferase